MKKAFRAVQFASNVGIIILTLVVGFVVLKQYVLGPLQPESSTNRAIANTGKTQIPRRERETPIGKVIPLENVNWQENEKTLVLYLSTTCRFCNESVPFYQRLVKETSKNQVKTVAAFTQPAEEAAKYLKSHSVAVDEIVTSSLGSIGVSSTPTILLINKDGVISDFWRGKLKEDKEAEVLAKLGS